MFKPNPKTQINFRNLTKGNLNKFSYDFRLETLAFHEVKGWQDEEEEFEQLGEYLKYSSK